MDTVTGVEMATKMGKLGGLAILPRFDPPDIQADKVAAVKKSGVVTAAAVGCNHGLLERAEKLVAAGATILNTDVAHGHMKKSIDAIRTLKQHFGSKICLLAGIAATYECAEDMYKAGADCVSSGIGAGSICITRVNTGCGLPGFESLLRISRAAKKYKKTFIPEAGIEKSGDIVKALAIGACAIMGGQLFAGTNETPGGILEVDGEKYKRYSGATSEEEKMKQVAKDPNGKDIRYTTYVEGVSGLVPYKGPVEDVVTALLAGVRSGISYVGAKNISELQRRADFVRVTNAGILENNYHHVALSA